MRRLGIFFGWDQHGSVIRNAQEFMRVAFNGDDPWVMSDAEIWFSTLWHFDSQDTWIDWTSKLQSNGEPYGANPQNGVQSVENILNQADGTGKRIWLALCFDFNDDEQFQRYGELIERLKDHPSLYTVGLCTDEWVRYPSDPDVAKQKFLQFADIVRSKGKPVYGHLFFAGGPGQGPMPDGVPWFIDNYDLVTLHNNYPHYDTNGVSNLRVMSGMLNYALYDGPALVGGTQGYFGAANGDQYRNGTSTASDYWLPEDFVAVIEDYEHVNNQDHAQVLFLAIHYVDDQWNQRDILYSTMEGYGNWLIEGGDTIPISYLASDSPHITVSVSEPIEFRNTVITPDETALTGVAPFEASLSGTLTDGVTGEGIGGKDLRIQVDGTNVGSTVTAFNTGYYAFTYTFVAPGTHDCLVRFAGDPGT
jgi:hypothetical protein